MVNENTEYVSHFLRVEYKDTLSCSSRLEVDLDVRKSRWKRNSDCDVLCVDVVVGGLMVVYDVCGRDGV